MGLDFYACNRCGEGFHDAGYYKSCDCGKVWCGDDCAKADDLHEHVEDNYEEISCKYCREEDYDDSVLLDFVLKREGISRQDLISLYKKESN